MVDHCWLESAGVFGKVDKKSLRNGFFSRDFLSWGSQVDIHFRIQILSEIITWMSRWKLGSMVRISGL